MECNEDELPGAENRCSEPKMLAVRREYLRRQITTLLEQRDFAAVEALENELPENVKRLVKHLAARSRLQRSEAQRLAGEMRDLPFRLYAFKSGDRAKYIEVSEYYLMTKNLVKAGNCTEFLLHLEPLVLTLQLSLLDQLLRGLGSSTADFIVQEWSGRQTFDPELLRKKLPALYTHYCQKISDCKRCDVSIYLCGLLLAYFPNVPPEAAKLFAHYDLLKESRNLLAHSLRTVTETDIKNACGVEPERLLEELEKTIIAVYPVCDPSIFHIYDRSIDYIKANL